jgi:hypothetical protein
LEKSYEFQKLDREDEKKKTRKRGSTLAGGDKLEHAAIERLVHPAVVRNIDPMGKKDCPWREGRRTPRAAAFR